MGDVAALRRLLDDGADVDEEKEEDGQTALHAAATMGHAAIALALLESGAHVDAEAKNGATPLMMAAAMGHVDVARTLIEFAPRGADVDAAHRYAQTTALHWAAEMGRVEVVALLCASGANVEAAKITGGTALHTASDANQTATVRVLLAAPCGADHTKLLVGDTVPLYLAAQRGFTEVGEALIEGGAAVNFVMPTGKFKMKVVTRDPGTGSGAPHYPEKNLEIGNGATVLHAAVENGHLEFTEMLLRHGALQSGSMEGATPLIIALQYRHPHIAKALLAAGGGAAARINARVPKDGASALFVAAGSGYADVVELLIAAGADVNIANNHGATALSHAVVRGRLGMAQRLLRAGECSFIYRYISRESCSQFDSLPLTSLTMLRGAGADAAAPASDGQTVLHVAAQRGDARAAALLLAQRGVAVDAATAGECSFIYRYIVRESCSQFDSLPLTSLTMLRRHQTASHRCTPHRRAVAGASSASS
jgi:ankyrin repeat protein